MPRTESNPSEPHSSLLPFRVEDDPQGDNHQEGQDVKDAAVIFHHSTHKNEPIITIRYPSRTNTAATRCDNRIAARLIITFPYSKGDDSRKAALYHHLSFVAREVQTPHHLRPLEPLA